MITEKIGNLFSKYKPRRVNVTLYGASNETYRLLCHNDKGFTQVMEGLAILKENGIDVKLNGTVVPENEHEDVYKRQYLYFGIWNESGLYDQCLCG